MSLARRSVVVTGGSDGIGYAIAEAFACDGSDVVIVGKESDGVARAVSQLLKFGGKAQGICADLSSREEATGLANKVLAITDRVDVLANNVGLIRFTPLADVDEAEFDAFMGVNLKAGYFLTQGVLKQLEDAKGCVINMTSYFATKNLPGRPSTLYSMTKGAVASLTKAMAYELGPRGIRVNAIAPGTVDSPGRTAEILKMSAQAQSQLSDYNRGAYPAGRIGRAEDVAGLALYLASPQAEWMTGSVIAIDGGLTTG